MGTGEKHPSDDSLAGHGSKSRKTSRMDCHASAAIHENERDEETVSNPRQESHDQAASGPSLQSIESSVHYDRFIQAIKSDVEETIWRNLQTALGTMLPLLFTNGNPPGVIQPATSDSEPSVAGGASNSNTRAACAEASATNQQDADPTPLTNDHHLRPAPLEPVQQRGGGGSSSSSKTRASSGVSTAQQASAEPSPPGSQRPSSCVFVDAAEEEAPPAGVIPIEATGGWRRHRQQALLGRIASPPSPFTGLLVPSKPGDKEAKGKGKATAGPSGSTTNPQRRALPPGCERLSIASVRSYRGGEPSPSPSPSPAAEGGGWVEVESVSSLLDREAMGGCDHEEDGEPFGSKAGYFRPPSRNVVAAAGAGQEPEESGWQVVSSPPAPEAGEPSKSCCGGECGECCRDSKGRDYVVIKRDSS